MTSFFFQVIRSLLGMDDQLRSNLIFSSSEKVCFPCDTFYIGSFAGSVKKYHLMKNRALKYKD